MEEWPLLAAKALSAREMSRCCERLAFSPDL
jgi:hypothetical protein